MDERQALFHLFEGLPRQGPGSPADTRKALEVVRPLLPDSPVVFDLGCGTGGQTLVLAEMLQSRIVASDIHKPNLDNLRDRAAAAGLDTLVETRMCALDGLEEAPGSIDLIWCEGAAYIVGVDTALTHWRPLLKPGGLVVYSDLCWMTGTPPLDAKTHWEDDYPAMLDTEQSIRRAKSLGYDLLDLMVLSREAWEVEYFQPLRQRIDELKDNAEPMLAAMIGATEREMDIVARFGHSFGYVFYVLRTAE